ncbi:uncharacterized protein LOC123291540 [Chrysoperla carnea]|uniref:uncharacterized protein LOC123291540 n=1 Tax=Chrysoperla carnea TaxID=189513 RepID=UPI001D074E37|nr:uncharacterized protein LOC123291540 [Chrysoperla carnea]
MEGFMGDHLRLKCEILNDNEKQTVQFFIKKQISVRNDQEKHLVDSFKTTVTYNKEALFYQIINDNNNLPINWGAKHFQFEKDETLLILEDISVHGFMLGKIEIFDLDHCKMGLKALARLHAFSIQLENEKCKDNPNYNNHYHSHPAAFDEALFSYRNQYAAGYMKASLRCLQLGFDYIPHLSMDERIEMKKKIKNVLIDFVELFEQPSKKFQNVFCHGDLWHKNIMFKYSDETPIDCNFVDFQELRYLPGAHDMLFFIYVNTTQEFRKENLYKLIEYYYEELYNEIKKIGLNPHEILPFYDFTQSYAQFYPVTKIIQVIYKQIHNLGDEYLSEQFKLKSDGIEIILGNREKFIIPAYEKNMNNYIDKMNPLYEELIESLLNPNLVREECYDIIRRKIHTNSYVLKNYQVLPHHSKNLLIITISLNETITDLKFFMKYLNDDFNRKEVFIYQILSLNNLLSNTEVMSLINQVMPKCYYSVNARTIVLENLEENGFKHVDTLDYQSVNTVIKTLAKFHAAYLILEQKGQTEKVHKFYEFSDITSELKKETIYTKSKIVSAAYDGLLSAVNELYPSMLSEISKLRDSEENFVNLLQPSDTYKNVLCHGNLTLENIMFKGEDRSECRFVDFKQSRLMPPAYDILTFLYMTTTQNFRDQYLNQIIQSYYNYLTEELQRAKLNITDFLTFNDFKNSFNEISKIALHQVIISSVSGNDKRKNVRDKLQIKYVKEIVSLLMDHYRNQV